MKLTVLGNNSALPAYGRYPTCQVLEVNGTIIVADCGEGAQILMQKHGVATHKIQHVFISHLHGDHYFGLFGLLTSMSLLGRTAALHLYGPKELWAMIESILNVAQSALSYPLHFHPLNHRPELIFDNGQFSLRSFPTEHGIFCCGLSVTEKTPARKLLPEACRAYGIPAAFYKRLQAGEDYTTKDGSIVANRLVTTEGKRPKKYAYCADTVFTRSFLSEIADADLLYHESTYLNVDADRAEKRLHSTAAQAATIAAESGAKRLVIGHYSSRYKDTEPFATEARAVFPETYASKEGDEFIV